MEQHNVEKKRLRELLLSLSNNMPIDKIAEMIKQHFNDWRGSCPKTDDSFIIGVKVE